MFLYYFEQHGLRMPVYHFGIFQQEVTNFDRNVVFFIDVSRLSKRLHCRQIYDELITHRPQGSQSNHRPHLPDISGDEKLMYSGISIVNKSKEEIETRKFLK